MYIETEGSLLYDSFLGWACIYFYLNLETYSSFVQFNLPATVP